MPRIVPGAALQWPLFNPASLRHSIQLTTPSSSVDSFGQPLTSWTVYLSTYAEIRMLSGMELYQSDEFTSAAQYRIRIRWPGGSGVSVKVGDRVLFGTHVYVIQIVEDEQMRNIALRLTCLEVNGASDPNATD
jgi:SPP1 family predicted phage head-tail adaptor